MMETIALYMRFSGEDANEGESYSIGNQRDLLHNFLKSNREFDGCTILEFLDDGYTGTNFDRPGVQKMLSMAGNPIKCIIVKDFSRFGRNLLDVGDYLDQIFPFLGVRFIAVNENYDSKNSLGSAVSLDVSLKAMVYEMYSRDISEKIRCVQQAKMQKGEYLGYLAFYGYKKSETVKNKLEVDEEAAAVVRRIFQMAVDGMTPAQIAVKLNEEGVPTPLGYRRKNHTDGRHCWKVSGGSIYWMGDTVGHILSDERYTGCLISRKRTKADVSTRRTVLLPKEEWIVAKDAHEAVVPKETFEQAQKVVKSFPRKKPAKNPSQRFRGLLKCAVCGRALAWVNIREPYFKCPTKYTVPDIPCRQLRLKEQDLEAAVLASIQSQARLLLQAETRPEKGQIFDALDNQIQYCQTEISRCKAKQASAFEDYAEGRLTRQAYLSCKQAAADRQEEMTARYMELSAERARLQPEPGKLKKLDLGRYACVNELTRELLVELIKEIRVSVENELEIVWNFREFESDQEG